VLTNPVRCCSAFAHTPTSPTSLDSRCSALRPEPEAFPRRTTARPLVRAKLLLRSTAYIIQTSVPSAVPRLGMLRNLYRLLAPPSAHTVYIYRHRTRAGVINYWRQGADDVLRVSFPTTPSERTRKNGPLQPEHAIWFPLAFAQSQTVSLRNVPDGALVPSLWRLFWGAAWWWCGGRGVCGGVRSANQLKVTR
jgi:hypothetical protein